jgi:PAS domain S-box-containing protein
MMLVSPTFDILMFHPGLERMWKRPASTFLGKKCYSEIEKREEPCPHCPGVVALQKGTIVEAETYAVLDDGTRVPFLNRAYPIYGVAGEAAGFVETCENISERRRGEDDARFEVTLISDLLGTSSTSRVLTLGLDAALRFEDAESGCIFTVDPVTGSRELAAQRGLPAAEIDSLVSLPTDSTVTTVQGASLLVRVPVMLHGAAIAELVVKLAGDRAWTSIGPRLEAVASVLSAALARIKEERLRGDAGMNIEMIVETVPTAIVFLDSRGIVTVWNREAERLFGWTRADALGSVPPFVGAGQEEHFQSLVSSVLGSLAAPEFGFCCLRKNGSAIDVWFRVAPLQDAMGDGTSCLLVAIRSDSGAVQLTASLEGGAQALEQLFSSISRGLASTGNEGMGAGRMSMSWSEDGELDIHVCPGAIEGRPARGHAPTRGIVVQNDEESGMRLGEILRDLGCSATVCISVSEALELLRVWSDRGERPDFAIVEALMPGESGGVETARLLRLLQPELRVVVTSDRGVVGHAAHGFTAAISRPYEKELVRKAVIDALGDH